MNANTPKRTPLPDWSDEDVFIIGGGSSLCAFDWSKLHGRNTIGCNQAYKHGAEVCNVCIFGDWLFWSKHEKDLLMQYGGWVATCYPALVESGTPDQPPQWVHCFDRADSGLSRDALAWNFHTGAAAINLALILGARRVLLLGYDCCRAVESKSHWHDEQLRGYPQTQQSYDKFDLGLNQVQRALPDVFPGREIFNVSNGMSKLSAFPILKMEDVFAGSGVAT